MTTRHDGRRPEEARRISIELDAAPYAEGSCLIATGMTRVLCAASIEEKLPAWRERSGAGWVTAEYGMLPRATHTRSGRERTGASGRTQEIQRLIGRSLRSVTDLPALGARTITVDCDVLQADGGTRTAAITGAYVAARLAVQKLLDARKLLDNPLLDSVAAVSVGVFGGRELLDLAYVEDKDAEVDFNIVMTGRGQFVEVQGSGEEATFSQEQLTSLIAIAQKGLKEIAALQTAFLTRQLLVR
jgi:ribonuclease PH